MNPDHIEIQFSSSAGKIRWNIGSLDEIEFNLLEKEMETYNRWITMLERGEAPEASYVGQDADESIYRYLARHWADGYMFNEFRHPTLNNLYERWNAYLVLKKKFKSPNPEKVYESVKYMPHFFEAPYSRDLFACGYKMLPMTQKVLGRIFANVGLNLDAQDSHEAEEPSDEQHDAHDEYEQYDNNGDYEEEGRFSDDSEIINFNSIEVYSDHENDECKQDADK